MPPLLHLSLQRSLPALRVLVAAGGLWAATAQAAVVPFTGIGQVVPSPAFNPNSPVWSLVALGGGNNVGGYLVDGVALAFRSDFNVNIDFSSGAPVPTGGTGSFQFFDPNGPDALLGTLTTLATATGFDISYVLTSAAGRFTGLTGVGQSSVSFTSDPRQFPTSYVESGRFTTAAQVPEPSSLALLLGAALALGLTRRSRPGAAPASAQALR